MSNLANVLLVGVGGMLGSMARYGVSLIGERWIAKSWLPINGTLLVNILGCFLLAYLWQFMESIPSVHARLRIFVGVGLLGGFTTFSTFGLETMRLFSQHPVRGGLNILLHVGLGLLSIAIGMWLAKHFHG